jgi:predicted dehydrogenase
MTERLRIGVLGTGAIVREFHLPALLNNPRVEVTALGNRRAASVEQLAQAHGIKQTYTDFARMAAASEIDAVVNALPNYLHAPVSIAMLQSGKHVLCEKPMALTVAEAQAMNAAAQAAGRQLMIAHPWRASAVYHWLRAIVRSGVLGKIFKARAHAVLAHAGPPTTSWFVQPDLAGGGAFTDIGIHSIDTLSFVFDDQVHPVRVFAQMGTYFQPIKVEDTAIALIEYDNGMVAEIEAGWHHQHATSPHGALELFGTEGYARTFPNEVRLSGGDVLPVPPPPPDQPHIQAAMYNAQIDHFVDCILNNAAPTCSGLQGQVGMQVLEAAYRSTVSGEAVPIPPRSA